MSQRELLHRPAPEEERDPLDRPLAPGAGDDGSIPDQWLHWEMATAVLLHRMPWTRFLHVKGGRRIRKTDFLLKRLIQKSLRRPPGSDLAYINRTIKQGKATAWKRLKRKFAYPNNWLLDGQPNENGLSIPVIGGRTIYIIGSEDPDFGRGLELTDVACDEASVNEDLPTFWNDILLPMLADKMGTADFAFTSRGKGWHYQQHQKGCARLYDENGERYRNEQRDESFLSLVVPTSKVGTVPSSELLRLRGEMGDDIYGQEFDCRDLDYVGLAVHQFLTHPAPEGNILPLSWYRGLKEHLTYFGVIDYARSSGSTVREVFGVDGMGRPVFINELVMPGGDPLRVANAVRAQDERLGVTTLFNVAGRDCWSKESSGKAMAEMLISRGIQCQPCAFSLQDAVGVLNQMCKQLEPAAFDPEGDGLPMFLILEGQCPKMIEQFCRIGHADLEKKSQHMKDALDCARMAVMQGLRALPSARPGAPQGLRRNRIEQLLASAGAGRANGGRHPRSGRPL